MSSLEIKQRKAVLVLGMHRSGTSLLANLLAAGGLTLGNSIMAAAEDNPEGFGENQRLVDLHEKVLGLFGQTWASPEPLPENWLDDPRLSEVYRQLAEITEAEFGEAATFCVKDPRLCRLLPLWRAYCNDVGIELHYVTIARPLEEVAASLLARDGIGLGLAQQLWARYNFDLLEHTADVEISATSYHALLEQPEKVGELITRLGLAQTATVKEIAKPQLRHHHSAAEDHSPWAMALYERLISPDKELPGSFQAWIEPLLKSTADSGLEIDDSHATSLFEETQEAKAYAASLSIELDSGREYIADLQSQLEARDKFIAEKDEFLAALKVDLSRKEKELYELEERTKADHQTKDEYSASLLAALEQKEVELKDTQQNLKEQMEETQRLGRELAELERYMTPFIVTIRKMKDVYRKVRKKP